MGANADFEPPTVPQPGTVSLLLGALAGWHAYDAGTGLAVVGNRGVTHTAGLGQLRP